MGFAYFRAPGQPGQWSDARRVLCGPRPKREGFGVVLLEANACGIPVITLDHEDNAARDLIEEGKNDCTCGLDDKQIAGRITDVFEKGMDNESRQFCADSARRSDWNEIANEVEAVI